MSYNYMETQLLKKKTKKKSIISFSYIIKSKRKNAKNSRFQTYLKKLFALKT